MKSLVIMVVMAVVLALLGFFGLVKPYLDKIMLELETQPPQREMTVYEND